MHLKTWRLINEVSSQTQPQEGSRQESRRAETSQATPTSQPQDLTQSKAQISIYFYKAGQCVFNMCARAPPCVRLCYLRSSQTESFTPGEVWSLRSAGHIVFIPLPISSIRQMTEASEGCGAEQPTSSVTASYQGCLAAQQMDEGNQSTGETLPSRPLHVHFSAELVSSIEREKKQGRCIKWQWIACRCSRHLFQWVEEECWAKETQCMNMVWITTLAPPPLWVTVWLCKVTTTYNTHEQDNSQQSKQTFISSLIILRAGLLWFGAEDLSIRLAIATIRSCATKHYNTRNNGIFELKMHHLFGGKINTTYNTSA